MGGRLIFERITCTSSPNCWYTNPIYPNHVECDPPQNEVYVRLDINDGESCSTNYWMTRLLTSHVLSSSGIFPLRDCGDGPGGSCLLERFIEPVEKRDRELTPHWAEMCGIENSHSSLSFLHQ